MGRRELMGYDSPDTKFPTISKSVTSRKVTLNGNHLIYEGTNTSTSTAYIVYKDGTVSQTRPTDIWWGYDIGDYLEVYLRNVKVWNTNNSSKSMVINWADTLSTSNAFALTVNIPANSNDLLISDVSTTYGPTSTERKFGGLMLGYHTNWNGLKVEGDLYIFKNGKRIL